MHAVALLLLHLVWADGATSPYDSSKEAQPSQLVASQADLAGLTT